MEGHLEASEIINKINNKEDIHYDGYIINGELDFTLVDNIQLEREFFYRSQINSEIILTNCTFIEKVIAFKSTLEGKYYSTSFNKDVDFRGSTFRKGVNFNFAKFRKSVIFNL
jgi:hypothetical protein